MKVLRVTSPLKHLLKLPDYLASIALFALMVVTFSDVMLRSVLNAPIEAGADLTRLLMTITVFAVMPALSARGGHISVDLLDDFFQGWGLSRVRDVLVNLFCGGILFWPAERVWVLAERSRSYGDVMEYLGMPVHYVGWFIAVFTGLTAFAMIGRGIAGLFFPTWLEKHSV